MTTEQATQTEPSLQPTDEQSIPVAPLAQPRSMFWPVVLALLVGGGVGWFVGHSTAPDVATITAKQFCSLGGGVGSNMLQIGGWIKGAQGGTDDWQAVITAIDEQCPAWRQQIVAKGESLNTP